MSNQTEATGGNKPPDMCKIMIVVEDIRELVFESGLDHEEAVAAIGATLSGVIAGDTDMAKRAISSLILAHAVGKQLEEEING